ncbi:MAG: cytochrome c oxidase subunit II [Rhodospirillaceae bacterium]|nr:cytochrome c oxidase subunit II [Rhodospirillaceae bacterium]
MTGKAKAGLAAVVAWMWSAAALAQEGTQMPTPAFPLPMQLNLQTPVSPVAQQIYDFHNYLLVMCTVISLFVLALLLICVFRFNEKTNPIASKTSHNTLLEVIWTAVPVVVLVIIAVPSYRLLYYMDRTTEAEMTLKVIGNQWFWTYEYPDQEISFDALALPDDQIDTAAGQHRLLETDRHVVLPVDTTIRILFTANDVIHAWTIPAFGVKLDNMPGRTNETWTRVTQEGRYYGQCSELCGVDHSFMPIVVDVVSKDAFEQWVAKEKAQAALPPPASATQLAAAAAP